MFAKSVVQFMRTYGFDGLDLDWEYPGLKERGGKRADYDSYVLMTKELRKTFNSAPEPFELTVAIMGNLTKLEMGFNLEGLAKYVDWFSIMVYDLWVSWDPRQIEGFGVRHLLLQSVFAVCGMREVGCRLASGC